MAQGFSSGAQGNICSLDIGQRFTKRMCRVQTQTATLEDASAKLRLESLHPPRHCRRIYIETRSRRGHGTKLRDQKRALPIFPFHKLHFCMNPAESHGFILRYHRIHLNYKRGRKL